jgi:hypothetical protein
MASIALATDPSYPVIGDYGQGLRRWTPPPLRGAAMPLAPVPRSDASEAAVKFYRVR